MVEDDDIQINGLNMIDFTAEKKETQEIEVQMVEGEIEVQMVGEEGQCELKESLGNKGINLIKTEGP